MAFLEHSKVSFLLSKSFHASMQNEVNEKHSISDIVECRQSWRKKTFSSTAGFVSWIIWIRHQMKVSILDGKTEESSKEKETFEIGPTFLWIFFLYTSAFCYSL